MLKFFRTPNCPACQAIEDILTELCLAHEIVLVSRNSTSKNKLPEGTRAPVLVDDGQVIQGSKKIVAHLEKLKDFRELWYKFQSDACYCGEDD